MELLVLLKGQNGYLLYLFYYFYFILCTSSLRVCLVTKNGDADN